jgi:hypothetical protein
MSMDRSIRLPWWRRKLWLQWGIAAIVAVLFITIAALFLGTPERSIRVAAASVTVGRVSQGTASRNSSVCSSCRRFTANW